MKKSIAISFITVFAVMFGVFAGTTSNADVAGEVVVINASLDKNISTPVIASLPTALIQQLGVIDLEAGQPQLTVFGGGKVLPSASATLAFDLD